MTLFNTFPNYPTVSQKEFRKWNEGMFKKYHNERVYTHNNMIIRFIERQRVKKLLSLLGTIKKGHKVLAAGCGEGYIEKLLPDCNLYMVDISKEAIKRAKNKLKGRPNTYFKTGNLENLNFPDNYFDKIECSEVIEHVLSPGKMMSEFHRVLKPKGVLVITFPNEPLINQLKIILIKIGLFRIFFANIPQNMLEEWHLRSFELNRFKEVASGKWKIERVRGAPFKLFPVRFIVKCNKD
ncbi:class I SAM-dependent methyltransferase [Patescibacteria group bacterium]